MRIVAGKFRGRIIDAPDGKNTRPTTDRVRESLFSALCARIDLEGCNVLDAFAGSGALGLEAISRGAAHVTFCERDAKAARVLEKNIATLGVGANCNVMRTDVFAHAPLALGFAPHTTASHAKVCASPASAQPAFEPSTFETAPASSLAKPYDVVFLDPPYATPTEKIAALLKSLEGAEVEVSSAAAQGCSLSQGALAVFEHDKKTDVAPLIEALAPTWHETTTKTYGKTSVTFLQFVPPISY